MRKVILLVVGACVGLGTLARAEDQPIRTTGWVSDEYCRAQHNKPGGEDCVRKCLQGGPDSRHPEGTPQRMVFVADKTRQVWVVKNPEILKGREGQHVRISGRVDEGQKTIRVTSAAVIGAAKQKEN